jgi:hypothetical protein
MQCSFGISLYRFYFVSRRDRSELPLIAPCVQVAPKLKHHMQMNGDAMIGFQPLGSWPNFFRIVFASAWSLTEKDLDALLDRMDALGRKLYSASSG